MSTREHGSAPSGGARLVETHTAIVFFVGDRACKLKKPITLDFLDFSTRQQRLEACEREVELNRRFAPDVYLGVADIIGPDGELADHLVVMRRLPDERRLTACLARNEDVSDALWRIAHLLVTAHASSPPDPAWDHVASVEEVRRNWDDNFELLDQFVGRIVDPETDALLEHLVHRFLDGRVPLFERRIAEGRVRDGHGDLLADDIFLLSDGPRVLDCLEFTDRLRWADVLCDAAFLAMDLERLGHPGLARQFLEWQRELAADSWPWPLAHHYIAYRAHVRAKVNAVRWEQGDAEAADRTAAFLDLALRHMETARVRLVLVGGLPGTGKSTIARGVGAVRPFVVLRSDEVRDELIAPDGSGVFGEGRYRPEHVERTYAELLRRARHLLEHGESVVLDASWNSAVRREEARRLAAATASDLIEIRCEAPLELAQARLRRRRSIDEDDPSEATPEIAAAMAGHFDPWPEAHVLDTTQPVDVSIATALEIVTRRTAISTG